MSDLVLVTGACGFAGSHMVDMLKEKGYTVRATDLENADKSFIDPEVEFIPADLTDKRTLPPVIKDAKYIFNPAAIFDYSAPYELLKRVNVDGMKNLCEVVLDEGSVKAFVHYSTIGVYGPLDPKKLPATEDHPKRPGNNYEKSKWEQEKIGMRYYEKEGLPITIIRPAPIYGPRNRYGFFNMIELANIAPVIPVPLNLNNKLVSVNVKDVVGLGIHLMDRKEAVGEPYTVIDDSSFTIREFTTFLATVCGRTPVPVYVPYPLVVFGSQMIADFAKFIADHLTHERPIVEKDTANYLKNSYWFSNKKLKSTGYKLLYPDSRIGLIETIKWYKQEGWLK